MISDRTIFGTHETSSAAETVELGERLGRCLEGGEMILLRGDLGSGKTTFVRGIARALRCTDPVSSPTFVRQQIYRGKRPLIHIDLYRASAAEAGDFDWAAPLEEGMIMAVEWSEKLPEKESAGVEVTFNSTHPETAPDVRVIEIARVVVPGRVDR